MMHLNTSYSTKHRGLPACPSTPNCVSSYAQDKAHYIAPLSYTVSDETAWQTVVRTVKSLPRNKIIQQSDGHLRLEVVTMIFRFVDDVDLVLDAENNKIQIRSASRVGYGDFGVNRRRVERIRKLFLQNLSNSNE